ncbi:MAG TPA: hypothetical protein VLV25_13300 [Steroidobacteraceae bacterium]|nr:hypothetical protein [Steroidobacteraceae bacterium]
MSARVPRRPEARRRAALALALALAAAAHADDAIHGRFEVQDAYDFARADSLDAALGARDWNDVLANLRLVWEPSWSHWSLMVHYLVTFEHGADVSIAHEEEALLGTPPVTWLSLGNRFIDRSETQATQGFDRLALGYTTPDFVLRIGRQALTWGSGLVFRPMDLFDPFLPNATDTEYKPGADMLYAQWLLGKGTDLQAVIVPRGAQPDTAPSADDSSFALHLRTPILGHTTTWLLARDYGDWLAGLGVNGALGGSTWNLELVPTFEARGATRFSALANISDAVTLWQRNATVFAEYFHNGFGVAGQPYDLASLPADLTQRLARGQLFDTRRDYLAGGLTLEVTPLFTVSPLLIAGIDDGSCYALVSSSYSLSDNLSLIAGAQLPLGRTHTEFGGLPLAPGSQTLLAPPGSIYLQLRRYF